MELAVLCSAADDDHAAKSFPTYGRKAAGGEHRWCGSSPISRVESISLWTQSDRHSKHSSDCVRNSLTATREHIVAVVSTMTPVTLASLLMFGREVDHRLGIERLSESFEDSIDGIMDDAAVK